MNYNPEIHHRKSYRMPSWDYARGGKYYVTICTRNRICCFGDLINDKIILNEMGEIVRRFWLEIPEHFPDTWVDEYIVMPNHIHGIIVMKRLNLNTTNGNVTNRNDGNDRNNRNDRNVGTLHATSLHSPEHTPNHVLSNCEFMSKISPKPGALNTIIRSFKSACTKKFKQMGHSGWFAWQPRFHDEIIRNDEELKRIRAYIRNNLKNWDTDDKNPKNIKP